MDRRSAMLMLGFGVAAAALPLPKAGAQPVIGDAPPGPPPGVPGLPVAAAEPGPGLLFADEFNGPAGAPPDPASWFIVPARETIRNPVEWDKPFNMGRYVTDQEHVFQDGMGNLVIRATRGPGANIQEKYASAKVIGNWRGGIGTTWEARIKLNCLTDGAWPAFWLINDSPVRGGEIDLVEWYGNRDWPSGTTVHARLDGTQYQTHKHPVDGEWHTWRMTWQPAGLYFWKDYQPGMQPFFTVPSNSLPEYPFNDPGYTMAPVFNIAVGGSGGREPAGGNYPADMLIDWIRVF
ncbi:glycoside hydrolase family 16 protein [Mycobacterium sp. CPCC 205372]|uniref:Glycoside hydrolase family 16 protein n=1 Tax=Mycobacterium hippophais TaxID=3016340 RepID=A0ABT4PU75_9MYCO|nr:glycoside hydrolase family 16 protein [Mycobacterium hippophais]MCZ8380083.1 glycoside hydrolase family 16 protein [Mycobacterium hippophais]